MSDTPRRTDQAAGRVAAHPEADAAAPPRLPRAGTPWGTLAARVISVVSRKGGVGKTTSTINIGAAFALSGHSVLLIGVDPQCGVARSLGRDKFDLDSGLLDVFQAHVPLNHLAYPTALEGLRFVTPNVWTLAEEEEFKNRLAGDTDTFVRAVDRARDLYDTILIDCPPGLGPETRAALLASDSYLVPVQAEELCRDSLGRLLAFIQSFRDETLAESNLSGAEAAAAPPTLEGLFLTMVSARTRMGRHVSERVAAEYGLDLFAAAVPRTTRLAEMALRGKPAVIYDRRSAGSRAYFDLMDEIFARWQTRQAPARPAAAPRPVAAGVAGAAAAGASGTAKPGNGGAPGPEGAPGNGGARPGAEPGASLRAAIGLHLSPPVGSALDDEDDSEVVAAWERLTAEPELVSLDELMDDEEDEVLAEEEEWDEGPWAGNNDAGRPH